MSNFIDDNLAVHVGKVDLDPVPSGQEAGYVAAAEWNDHGSYLDDVKVRLRNQDATFHPDAVVTAPNALDEEFKGNTLNTSSKWTALNAADLAATPYVLGNGSLVLTKKATTNTLAGYLQAFAPGTADFTFEAKIGVSLVSCSAGGAPGIGILLGDGTKYLLASVFFDNRATPGFGLHYWTDFSTFNSNLLAEATSFAADQPLITDGVTYHRPLWLRMRRAAADAYLGWSPNGYDYQEWPAVGAISNLAAIASIGFGAQNNNGHAISPRFFHFRKTA